MSAEHKSNHNKFLPEYNEAAPAASHPTMEDDAVWELLGLYADGEASPAETAQVEALLRSDMSLAREFAFLKNTSQIVQSIPDVMPPDSLRDAIFAATIHRPTLMQRLAAFAPHFTRYALPVGGLAAAATLALVFWPHSAGHAPVTRSNAPQRIAASDAPMPNLTPIVPLIAPDARPTGSGPNTAAAAMTKPTPASDVKPRPTVAQEKNPAKVPNMNTGNANSGANGKKSEPHSSVKANKHPQTTAPAVQSDPSTVVQPDYSPQPNMDRPNMKPVVVANAPSDTDKLPDSEHSAVEPKTTQTGTAAVPDPPQRMVGRLLHPVPDARQFVTTASLRQRQQAYNQGYTEMTVKGIEQHQIVAGVGSRF